MFAVNLYLYFFGWNYMALPKQNFNKVGEDDYIKLLEKIKEVVRTPKHFFLNDLIDNVII